jgi:2-polyprenyl-3-methyl-5-hydroxy-6-metoxy-1,4-benzoquinol methylase
MKRTTSIKIKNASDQNWEHFGEHDPYWAVVTQDKFKRSNLNQDSLDEFFASGENWISDTFAKIRHTLDASFAPRTGLDFGCGVGRLLVPLARRLEYVVGVDVSPAMLKEAQQNCVNYGFSNYDLILGDVALSRVTTQFDIVTSFIVFQHIPFEHGIKTFQRLVDLVTPNGFGVLHILYSKDSYTSAYLKQNLKDIECIIHEPYFYAQNFKNARSPVMLMNPYDLNYVFHVLQIAGITSMHVEFTDHGGEFGVTLFFGKNSNNA